MIKIELTEIQAKWLEKNFKNTKNDDILEGLEKLGIKISPRTMSRIAKDMGLKKSKQFLRKMTNDALEKMRKHNEETCYAGARLGAIMQWREYRANGTLPSGCFKPGHGVGPHEKERIERFTKSRNELIRKERRRIELGLEQKTKLRLIKNYSMREKAQREYARKHGYIVFRDSGVIYFDNNTRRAKRFESNLVKDSIPLMHISCKDKKII